MKRLALILSLVLVSLCAGWTSSARAEAPPARAGAPLGVSKEEAARVLNLLKDDAKRDELIRTLEVVTAAAGAPAPPPPPTPVGALGDMLAKIAEGVAKTGRAIGSTADAVADLPKLWRWLQDAVSNPDSLRALGLSIGKIIGVILTAWAAVWLYGWMVEGLRRRFVKAPPDAPKRARILPALIQTVLDAAGVALFAFIAFAALSVVDAPFRVKLAAIAVINANLTGRIGRAVGRAVLAPDAPGLRLAPLSDETAAYLFVWLKRFVDIAAIGWFGLHAAQLLGLPDLAFSVAAEALGLGLTALAVVFVLQNRRPVAVFLQEVIERHPRLGASWSGTVGRLADFWHIPTLAYVAAAWGVWAFGAKGGFQVVLRVSLLTILALGATKLVDGLARRGLDRLLAVSRDLVDRLPGLQARADLYLPGLRNGLRGLVLTTGGALLLQVWGVDIFGWLASAAGRRTLGSLVSVALMLIGALILWEIASTLIERAMGAAATKPQADRSSRAKTLLPLLRNAIKVGLVVVVGLMVLSELGVNIAPLLAGAGVVGLAVGFGAQTLVRDVITGLFILFEDSIRIGDVVSVGGKTGTVVGLTIRAVTLRDADGVLVSAPFSTISVVENMTKDFSYYTIDLPIEAGRDVEAAIRSLEEVDVELRRDPVFAPQILAPLEVMGVAKIEPTLSTVRARTKTAPGKQWAVGREYNRRLMTRLRQAGVWGPVDVVG